MLKDYILELLFPRRCLSCSAFLAQDSKGAVCAKCLAAVPFKIGFACSFCSAPVGGGKTCHYCLSDHFLDRLIAAAPYDQPLIEKMVKFLKYSFIRDLSYDTGEIMIDYLVSRQNALLEKTLKPSRPIVTAVPLHRRRLNWRGFNQSELLARKIAEHFGWQYQDGLLKRIKQKKPQAKIVNRRKRQSNVLNAFKCLNADAICGRTVLLIDDVATTGATLDDCARTLKGAGAQEVIGFVFARGS